MSQLADDAALRIMLRSMAPVISDVFEKCAAQMGEFVSNLYLIMLHKPGGNLDNPYDHIIQIKSLSGKIANLSQDPTKRDKSAEDTLADLFPIAKELIGETAQEWNLTPYDLFLFLRIKPGEDVSKANTTYLSLRTKKMEGRPQREKVIS